MMQGPSGIIPGSGWTRASKEFDPNHEEYDVQRRSCTEHESAQEMRQRAINAIVFRRSRAGRTADDGS